MNKCKICGCDVLTVSSIDDVCTQTSCWREAYPSLFENETVIPQELHDHIMAGLTERTLKQKFFSAIRRSMNEFIKIVYERQWDR